MIPKKYWYLVAHYAILIAIALVLLYANVIMGFYTRGAEEIAIIEALRKLLSIRMFCWAFFPSVIMCVGFGEISRRLMKAYEEVNDTI